MEQKISRFLSAYIQFQAYVQQGYRVIITTSYQTIFQRTFKNSSRASL
jgi:hypothetical protein